MSFDVILYDKRRGRALNENKLPFELMLGGQTSQKFTSEEVRFEPNTEIEPRVYPTNIEDLAGSDTRQVICIMFKGYLALEDKING